MAPGLRRWLRLAALLLATLGHYLLWLLAALVSLPSRPLRRRLRNLMFRSWSRCCVRLIGGRVRVEGSPPAPPFFLVSNHLSYVDIIVLASRLDGFFIAKSEIAGWPLMGRLSRSIGTIFVDREMRRDVTRVNRLVEDTLQEGHGIFLFPEGTSTQGADLLPFRSSLLAFPAQAEMPVHAAALHYATTAAAYPAHQAVCWWGDSEFWPHARKLLEVPSFVATIRFAAEPVVAADRKQLGRDLEERVREVFVPVVAPERRAELPWV